MALISIKRNVDLQPGLNAPAVFNCSQGDKGTTMMLGLMNGGNDYTVPSGVTITIRGSRSNGAVFTPTSATSSGSTVSFTLTEEMTDTAGPTLCEAVLEQGNNVLGTANFIINVEGSPMGADVPPVFTDAAWTWMLGKLTTETVPALGDDVISSIQGKVDKSQGSTNAKKFLRVNTSGNVSLASTDKTLSVADQIADAKETGDQIRALDAEIDGVATTLGGSISTLNGITTDLQSSKLNKNQGTSNAGKTMVVDSSGNIVPGDVPITIDDTLSIADAAADAKAAGDAIALKANASTIAPEFSDQNTYTAGSYVLKNGVLYRFTADHTGAWTGSDAVVATVGGEVDSLAKSTASEFDMLENALLSKTETTGSTQILVPGNIAISSANIVSLGTSVTGIKTTGKNLYPHGTIALYDYGFYTSSLTSAKNRGLRLPVGVYTLTFTTSEGNNRIQARAWKDDGTLLNEAGADKPIRMRYLKNDSTLNPLYWQTYRFATALPETAKKIIIEVHDFPVWFLFCEDANTGYATSVTNVQIESGYDNATTYEAYHVNEYPATASKISVVPGGLINFTEADQTDTSCTVAFYAISDEGNRIIANQYDTTESGYVVGDYCINSGKLYRCTTAQETGTDFNPANWAEIIVMDEIKAAKGSIDTLESDFNNYKAAKDENLFLRPYMQTPKPKLFAHTGYTSESAPENTIPAYIAAGEKRFYGVEADVQKTSDGYYVMMHDTTVDRMTDGSGSISSMTLAQIQALHIKDHPDLTVPTFEEFLAICRMYGMIPQIELKSTIPNTAEGISNVIQVIKDAGLYNTAILTGSYYNISAVRAADQFIPFGIIGQAGGAVSFSDIVAAAVAGKNLIVALESTGTITDQMKKDCRDNNVPLIMFTATTVAGIRNMFNAGADMVTVQGTGVYIPEPTA